ncbi:MAG: response regulator transcription factor [Hyphomicrobium sp.]
MKILLVEDHAVVREGVRKLLAEQFRATIFEAADVETGLRLYDAKSPELIILDLNLDKTGGLEMLRRILARDPKARILIFTTHSEPVYAARAMRAGARGYVSKSAPAEELVSAVKKVAAGGQYIDRDVASRLAICQFSSDDPLQKLTVRELEILRKLGNGASLSDIAESLGVAYKTVANTCSQIKIKLGVERTADLIRLSVETLRK